MLNWMSKSTLYGRSHRYLKNAEEVANAKADEISESDRPDLEEIESKQGEAQSNLDGATDKCAATKQTLSSLKEFLWRLRIRFFKKFGTACGHLFSGNSVVSWWAEERILTHKKRAVPKNRPPFN